MANGKNIDPLEMEKIKLQRLKVYGKILTVLISVGIGTYGVAHMNNIIQERRLEGELKQQEMSYLGKFLSAGLDDKYAKRLRFAEYFATLTSSEPLKSNWIEYQDKIKDSMKTYYIKYTALKKLQMKNDKNDKEKEKEKELEREVSLLQMELISVSSTTIASIAEETEKWAAITKRLEVAEKLATEAKASGEEAKKWAVMAVRPEVTKKVTAEAKASPEEVEKAAAPRIVSYDIHYKTKYMKKNATVTLQPSSGTYVIYNQPGGCGPNDIAWFSINDHILETYIKDSCDAGTYGIKVNLKNAQLGDKSRAVDYGYWVECELIKKNYSEKLK